jgi:hypothetical protein
MFSTIRHTFVVAALLLASAGCSVKSARTPGVSYPQRVDKAKIIWRQAFVDADPASYEIVGQVQKRTTWCGVTQAAADADNHATVAEEAARLGADVVVLDCGAVGTVGECTCFGTALRTGPDGIRKLADRYRCVPGESRACVGPGGCQGGQACKQDGTGYTGCDCGAPK